jgi:hypothetical protein
MSSQQGRAVRRNYLDPHQNPRGKTAPNQSEEMYNDLYHMYYNTLTELCANRFKWTGLPDSVDPRFLEMTLFRMGLAVFYYDERYEEHYAMRATPAGEWNMYDNPTGFQVNGNAFINRYLTTDKCVPIWANYTRRPELDIVSIYSRQLANLDVSLDLNARQIRRSKVVFATEDQKLTAQNITAQLDRGDGVVMVNKKYYQDLSDFKVSDFSVEPKSLTEAHMYRTRKWAEVMGLLGIDNANQDKKERVTVNEVSANDGQTENMRRVSLNARQQAAEQINKMFDLDEEVTVKFWVDSESVSESTDTPVQNTREVVKLHDGSVHDRTA